MTALPAPVRPKLAKLVTLLGSDRDGEVIATARAIIRTLTSAGSTLFDLAEAVEHEPTPHVIYVQTTAPVRQPESWGELARWCRDNDRSQLAANERAFVRDMANRLVMRGEPTDKQAAWLRSLYAKLGGAS